MLWLSVAVMLCVDGGSPLPSFAQRARQVKVGTTQQRVRALLGEPLDGAATSTWTYNDPPNRPDGPYHWYRFTFAKGKVASMEDGGVACILRE